MSATTIAWTERAVTDLGSNTMHQNCIQSSQQVRDLLTGTVPKNKGLDVPTNSVLRALATEQAGPFMLLARLYPAWERGYTAADIREAGRRWPDVYPPRVVALAEAFEATDPAVAVADVLARPLLPEELQMLMRGMR